MPTTEELRGAIQDRVGDGELTVAQVDRIDLAPQVATRERLGQDQSRADDARGVGIGDVQEREGDVPVEQVGAAGRDGAAEASGVSHDEGIIAVDRDLREFDRAGDGQSADLRECAGTGGIHDDHLPAAGIVVVPLRRGARQVGKVVAGQHCRRSRASRPQPGPGSPLPDRGC